MDRAKQEDAEFPGDGRVMEMSEEEEYYEEEEKTSCECECSEEYNIYDATHEEVDDFLDDILDGNETPSKRECWCRCDDGYENYGKA